MGDRALILSGGGPVGIAWEAGLAAGLEERGVRIAGADRIVGTSAGAFVGAALASGRPAEALVRAQVEMVEKARAASPKAAPPPPPDLGPLMKFFATTPAPGQEAGHRAEMGAYALAAKTISEEQFLASFGSIARPGEAWPHGYACTAVDAADGTFHLWEESSGVDLGHAIASSCSVPGVFPPVTIHGRRYIDGGIRSGTCFDLGKGYARVLCVAVMGNGATEMMRARIDREIAVLTAAGAKVALIVPDALCREAFGPNMMDGSRRGDVALAGVVQGRGEAERLAAFWN
ncbi:MAG TPA: patatin-like phospholipase family protein [Rhizomicrobium sp.]|jgi:NTE family protein|nr:patatin-like phospholipase family protein [Rhizomicrobium sp.]